MTALNPYEAPTALPEPPHTTSRLMWSSVAVVLFCVLAGGAIGLGLGAGVATFFPDYYREVFRGGNSPGFDPFSIGMAAGITQGTFGGGVTGIALVALFYWFRIRALKFKSVAG